MFLERCGKFCFSQMRPLLFFSLVLTPILLALLFLFFETSYLQDLENRFLDAAKKGKTAMERKKRKEQFHLRYSNADPFFLDQKIESLSFLQKEREQLEALLHHPALFHKRLFQERLFFLSKENQLAFAEEELRKAAQIKETEERQRQSIQVDEEDLQKILSLVEDVPMGSSPLIPHRPQLIIRDFHLKKKETPLHLEVWELDMQLLKREFKK